jgi:hypothetical protein
MKDTLRGYLGVRNWEKLKVDIFLLAYYFLTGKFIFPRGGRCTLPHPLAIILCFTNEVWNKFSLVGDAALPHFP